jgi:hypothetical protein
VPPTEASSFSSFFFGFAPSGVSSIENYGARVHNCLHRDRRKSSTGGEMKECVTVLFSSDFRRPLQALSIQYDSLFLQRGAERKEDANFHIGILGL